MTTTNIDSRYLPGTYAQKRPDAAQKAQHYVRQWEQKEAQRKQSGETSAAMAPTICFSRKIGVGALEIAEVLAQKTGQRVADRLILDKIATDAELGQKTVSFFDERHPGKMSELGAFLFGEKSFIMSDYLRKLFSAVMTLADTEPTIFVGRGTHLILPRDRVLAVRLISSKAYRIQTGGGYSRCIGRRRPQGTGCRRQRAAPVLPESLWQKRRPARRIRSHHQL
jgi:hypothetical protein